MARVAFEWSLNKDLVSCNSMISVYVDCGEAQKLFDDMRDRDVFSWAALIDGYAKLDGDFSRAQESV